MLSANGELSLLFMVTRVNVFSLETYTSKTFLYPGCRLTALAAMSLSVKSLKSLIFGEASFENHCAANVKWM